MALSSRPSKGCAGIRGLWSLCREQPAGVSVTRRFCPLGSCRNGATNQMQTGLPPSLPSGTAHLAQGCSGASSGPGFLERRRREHCRGREEAGKEQEAVQVCAVWKGSRRAGWWGAPCPLVQVGRMGVRGGGAPGKWGTGSQRSPGGRAVSASRL